MIKRRGEREDRRREDEDRGRRRKGGREDHRRHLEKALEHHSESIKCMEKSMLHLGKAAELADIGKASGSSGLHHHLSEAHRYLTRAMDVSDLEQGHLEGAMNTHWVGEIDEVPTTPEPGVYEPERGQYLKPQSELTEGYVSDYPSDEPYDGGRAPRTGIPTPEGMKRAGATMTKAEMDEMIRIREENAFLKGQFEALKRSPSAGNRPVIFNGGGSSLSKADSGSPMMDGVDPAQASAILSLASSEMDVRKSGADIAAKMIANQISKGMGRKLTDPAYRGGATSGGVGTAPYRG